MQHHTRMPGLKVAILAALALLALAACRPPPPDPFVVADLFATPGKALATIALSPTPEPTETPANYPTATAVPTLPLPTVVVLQQPTMPISTAGPTPTREIDAPVTPPPALLTCPPPPMPFTPAWQNYPEVRVLIGCPTGTPQTVGGVFQFYQTGAMFWRQSDNSIFVLSNLATRQGRATDSWWRFADTFQEGESQDESGLAPEGLIEPVRGFGKVWRSNAFIRDAVGWATDYETPIESQWLQFEKGWMMTGPGGSPIYVMIPLDAPPYSSGLHFGPLP